MSTEDSMSVGFLEIMRQPTPASAKMKPRGLVTKRDALAALTEATRAASEAFGDGQQGARDDELLRLMSCLLVAREYIRPLPSDDSSVGRDGPTVSDLLRITVERLRAEGR